MSRGQFLTLIVVLIALAVYLHPATVDGPTVQTVCIQTADPLACMPTYPAGVIPTPRPTIYLGPMPDLSTY